MPKSPMKSPQAQKNPSKQNTGPRSTPVLPLTHYDEAQNDEVEVLRAVFMEDFEEVETRSAWSKSAERAFKIRLQAYSSANVSVTLTATLTATYPKSIPLLGIEDDANLELPTRNRVRRIITARPKELIGEVMIHEIATAIQDVLEDSMNVKTVNDHLPSLEQERAEREAVAAQFAHEQEQEVLERQQEERAEESRALQRMVDDEMKRRDTAREVARKKRRSEQASASARAGALPLVSFDQAVSYQDDQGNPCSCPGVSIVSKSHSGPVTDVYMTHPAISELSTSCFILKRAKLSRCRIKKSILDLEDALEKLKILRHNNIIEVMEFKIENDKDEWNVDVLTEIAVDGSLKRMLQLVDVLPANKARSMIVDLLEGLEFYHKNGVLHNRIHAGNVLVCQSPSGDLVLKLGDASFQAALYDLMSNSGNLPSSARKVNSAWLAPEHLEDSSASTRTRKSDVWDFGVVIVEMLFGLQITKKFGAPATFINGAGLSGPFEDLVRQIFKHDAKKRPSAFEILPYEFLRTDVGATAGIVTSTVARRGSVSLQPITSLSRRLRRESSNAPPISSRYASEFVEAGRLGKGGYGEVVKARHKIDGRIYAIKKITNKSQSSLNKLLSEVYLLATLNHPYVVRYYTAWPEDEVLASDDSGDENGSLDPSSMFSPGTNDISFGPSTGGLDFISSSGYPKIEFGGDSDSSDVEVEGEDETSSESSDDSTDSVETSKLLSYGNYQQTQALTPRPVAKTTLYIQMEYCEKLTLRDMIRRGMHENIDEGWRVLRQVLEGLVHIHSAGIIHRDLKPENIFMDVANNPRIGDFGLATSGQYFLTDSSNKAGAGDMTRSVGTTFYVAPELKSSVSEQYTDKVDMYSLGIIFFEMSYPLSTGMERVQTLNTIREENHELPEAFKSASKVTQGEIIDSLIRHRPKERPSSVELLRNGKIPVQIQDETIRLALEGLSDEASPYYDKMMSALFTQSSKRRLKDHMWDMGSSGPQQLKIEYVLLQSIVQEKLTACFRRHGAVQIPAPGLMPRSDHYLGSDVVQLISASGTLVQMPYDLTLPHARNVAKHGQLPEKTFVFGTVYRECSSGTAPLSNKEVDFDITSYEAKDLALKEAEVIKVMDEILDSLPPFVSTPMCYHISHSALLEIIMDFCRVGISQRASAKETLSKLGIKQWTWQKIRLELRAPNIALSSTSLDELAHFDFRDTPAKCFTKLQAILTGSEHLAQVQTIFTHISGLVEYLKRLGVKRKVYFSPLSSFNEKFYRGEIMFQCLYDTKKRDVVAAGGRYDRLIDEHRSVSTGPAQGAVSHAVGINIAWDRLVASMARWQKQEPHTAFLKRSEDAVPRNKWATRRCDVLVASFDAAILRSLGAKIVGQLWSHDISAELADDTGSPEELLTRYREGKHSWIVLIKHEPVATGKPDLKLKSMDKHEDFDIRSSDLMSYLSGEIRDRDAREGTNDRAKLLRQSSHHAEVPAASEAKSVVQVLMANHKSKKANKWRMVETAQERARDLVASFSDGPIACIEISDEILDRIRETRMSDPESWRRVVQNVPLSERQYVHEVHDLLSTFKAQHSETNRYCFVYNFRTATCIHYDMKL